MPSCHTSALALFAAAVPVCLVCTMACGAVQFHYSASTKGSRADPAGSAEPAAAVAPPIEDPGDVEMAKVEEVKKKLTAFGQESAPPAKYESLCKETRASFQGSLQEGGPIYELFMVCITLHPRFVDLPSASHPLVPWADPLELRDFKRYVGDHACRSQHRDCEHNCPRTSLTSPNGIGGRERGCVTSCANRFETCKVSYQSQ